MHVTTGERSSSEQASSLLATISNARPSLMTSLAKASSRLETPAPLSLTSSALTSSTTTAAMRLRRIQPAVSTRWMSRPSHASRPCTASLPVTEEQESKCEEEAADHIGEAHDGQLHTSLLAFFILLGLLLVEALMLIQERLQGGVPVSAEMAMGSPKPKRVASVKAASTPASHPLALGFNLDSVGLDMLENGILMKSWAKKLYQVGYGTLERVIFIAV
ncbi:MAG: hypothetical protein FRX49_12558 [Trebouxia sp. A1-2]|nr:MAG: hypothetical protein FRX49_12558 [Trebouxia sp. A1-2]